MTINELLEQGVVIHCLGKVLHVGEADEAHPYGHEQTLFEGKIIDLHAPIGRGWADREIRYIYPLPGEDRYPILVIEVE